MILEMKVPSPGESITEVEIAQWLVSNGDYVEKDQAIAEVDSDKATLELPAEVSGTVTLKAEEGDAVMVGSVVCLIDTDGKATNSSEPNTKISSQVEVESSTKAIKSKDAELSYANQTPSPAAKKIMNEAENLEKNSNQLLAYTKIIKDSPLKTKSEIIEQLWKILISDNNIDLYESNLMRRICGLIYFSDKESGEIKMRLIKSK